MASTVLLLVQYLRERFFKGGEFRDLAHYHLEETEQPIRETYPEEADCPGSRVPADTPDLTPPASQFSSFSSCWWYTIPQPWWNTLSSPLTGEWENKVICFSGIASNKPFSLLAVDRLYSHDFLEKTQCLPLYRYTAEGKRVSNITEWAVRRVNEHYRAEWGEDYGRIANEEGITAEQIFAYTYAVLHDPVYRHDYAVDLLRGFPRLPLYPDFHHWTEMGQRLLDLHIGFESADPYPLERNERKDVDPTRAILRADKKQGTITLDERTTLVGIPAKAWEYRLGSRSALEWVLDQYKERNPRDPTIAAKFNTYKFADYKEQLIDLLRRVCTVSVETMEIIDMMHQKEK